MTIPTPAARLLRHLQGLSLTIAGLGKLSRGRSGTREPILSRFLVVSSPSLASFTPQHLSVSLHGLSLFDHPPPTEYMEKMQEGEGGREGGREGRRGAGRSKCMLRRFKCMHTHTHTSTHAHTPRSRPSPPG